MGASVATGQQILKPALADFMHQYPELTVQLNLVNRRIDFIEEGFDVVIRIGQLNDSMLIAKKLGTVTRRLFASPTYIAQQGEPKAVEQLINHKLLIMNPINNDFKLAFVSTSGSAYTITCKPRLLVDDFSVLKQSIVDGLGIAVLPEYIAQEEVEAGKLVKLLPAWGMEDIDIYALYPRNRAKIPKVKAFLNFITELYDDTLN